MQIIGKNIRFLRDRAGWTQKELALKVGTTRAMIGAYEEFRTIPIVAMILKLADTFQVDLNDFVRLDLSKKQKAGFVKDRSVLVITTDSANFENVELVTQKASAGYLSGYQDIEYIKNLPKLSLPFLSKQSTHRAFEISGDSMLPVQPGSVVVGEYVSNLSEIKNGDLCIVITNSEGILYKRVYNFLKKSEHLLMVSDNLGYDPYLLKASEIFQVWRQKKIISNEINAESQRISGEQLANAIYRMNHLLSPFKSTNKSNKKLLK